MTLKLVKESVVAAEWELSLEQMRILRRRHGWACVKFSRQDIRYTEEQLARIVHELTTKASRSEQRSSGQTSRSQKRAS